MKQYFTGFFTAICLTTSVFIFMGSTDNNMGHIIVDGTLQLFNAEAESVVESGALYANEDHGQGFLKLNDENGIPSWNPGNN